MIIIKNTYINIFMIKDIQLTFIFQQISQMMNIKNNKKNITQLDILSQKINICQEIKNYLICDNFYLFPFSKLKQFHKITNENINTSFHNIKDEIEKSIIRNL